MNQKLLTLKSTLACVIYSGDQHTEAKIKETDPNAKLKLVNIKAQNGDWFLFDPDKGRGQPALMSPLLKVGTKHDPHDHHRACDAVIVVLKERTLWLIYIDLKSSAPSGYISQFQSTRQFAKYLLVLLEEFHAITFQTIEERFLLLHTSKSRKLLLDKKPTSLKLQSQSSKDPKQPQKELVNDGVTLYLKQLLV